MEKFGLIALFGSGEISPTGRKIHDFLFARLPSPVKVAILETPAGFQPNVEVVAREIEEFFKQHLQNYHPQITIIQARKKGGDFDPDDPKIVEPILQSNYIFAGPGSPTYTVRNLKDTLASRNLTQRHGQGAILSIASAAAIAMGKATLPVYEIFKAGCDLYWQEGLDFFGRWGFNLAIITHWNNQEGGEKLDTSRCYMGRERFARLLAMLDKSITILGIDEMTACIFDFEYRKCLVMGNNGINIIKSGNQKRFEAGDEFSFENLQ